MSEAKLVAILKEGSKREIKKEIKQHYYGGKANGTSTEYSIGYTLVRIQQGVVQSEVPMSGPISEEIKPFVVLYRLECTLHSNKSNANCSEPRAHGKYLHPEHQETIGQIEFYMGGVDKVTCEGPDREKVIELYEMICAGSIRPSDEWGGPQVKGGPDYIAELEAQLESKERGHDKTRRYLADVEDVLRCKTQCLSAISDVLSVSNWPLVSRQKLLAVMSGG